MKILYVAVFENEGKSSDNHKLRELEELGNLVFPYNYRERARVLGGKNRDVELLNVCKLFNPDVTIFAKCNTISINTFIEIKKISTTFYWFADPFITYNQKEYLEKTKLCDYFICDKENVLKLAKTINKNSLIIHDGYDKNIELPKDVSKKYDISFIGNLYNEKRNKIINSIDKKVDIISDAFGEKHSIEVSKSIINLNICTTDGVSDRVLKVLAARGFLLTDDWEGREKYFEDKKHFVIYNDATDLNEKIDFYLQNKEKRDEIAAAGQQKVIMFSSYMWAKNIIKLYNQEKTNFNASKNFKKPDSILIVNFLNADHYLFLKYVNKLKDFYDKTFLVVNKNINIDNIKMYIDNSLNIIEKNNKKDIKKLNESSKDKMTLFVNSFEVKSLKKGIQIGPHYIKINKHEN